VSQSNRTGQRTTPPALGLKEYKYWSVNPNEVIDRLQTSANGLTKIDANGRLAYYGKNISTKGTVPSSAHLILSQFKSPLVLIFIAAAILSFFLEDPHDAIIIIVILFTSVALGFWQERGASNTVKRLLSMLKTRSVVLREGKEEEILAEEVVPGDILVRRAGDKVPCDCLLLESKDLFVDESFLTGESYPVEKSHRQVEPADSPLRQRENSVFMGSYVISGQAKVIAVRTGRNTEFSEISSRLKTGKPETDFQKGIRHFGYLLAEITLVLVIANFAINVYLQRPVLDSFLFSLALAIGLTPQLLPAIVSVNIAHGAKRMAAKKVIVKRLDSIENLGSMNMLCSDKTGTLTVGSMELHSAIDASGSENARVFHYAYLNAINETGFVNPIDQAIVKAGKKNGLDTSSYAKLDEIPYDFARKRLTILVSKSDSLLMGSGQSIDRQNLMITKGAFYNILEICSTAEMYDKIVPLGPEIIGKIRSIFEEMSRRGFPCPWSVLQDHRFIYRAAHKGR
jgi:Mg2+-importing ATPase